MNGRFYFPRVLATARLWIVCTVNFRDLASSRVLHEIVTLDDIAIAQPDFIPGIQAVVAFGRRLAEVVLFDPELAAKGHRSRACVSILGVVDGFQELHLALGIVRQHQLEGAHDRHHAQSRPIQILPNVIFEVLEFRKAVRLGHAEIARKSAQTSRRVAAPAHATDGWHSGIIPAFHHALLHELQQLALAQ